MIPKLFGIVGVAGSGKDTVGQYLASYLPGACMLAFADPLKEFCQLVFGFSDAQVRGTQAEKGAPDARYVNAMQWRHARIRLYMHAPAFLAQLGHGGETQVASELLTAWFEKCLEQGREFTPRFAMQTLGTEWGRKVDEDLWAVYACSRAHLLTEPWYRFVRNYPRLSKIVDALHLHRVFGYVKHVIITDCRFVNEARTIRGVGGAVWRITRNTASGAIGGVQQHPSETEQTSKHMDLFVSDTIANDGTFAQLYAEVRAALQRVRVISRVDVQ